jgi:periplasmic protein TonB
VKSRTRRRYAPLAIGVAVVVLVAPAIGFIRHMLATSTAPQRTVQLVQLIRPPPPPPDVPPPPPPPEEAPVPVTQNEPEPSPGEDSSPSDQLGLDADGGAGSDAFGLAARKGGHDLLGAGGAAFAWYTGRLKDQVVEKVTADARLRSKKYSVSVRVWIDAEGRIKDVKIASSSGNRELDQEIAASVAAIQRLDQPPPLEMPEPVTLKIVSRS